MKRIGIISFFGILLLSFIFLWNYSYRSGLEEAYIPLTQDNTTQWALPAERGVFENLDGSVDYSRMIIDEEHQRSLADYYDNRAYHGAPPYIPHPVADEKSMGGTSCLKCHDHGGFVAKFSAYAPVSPHPEMVNCRQCHVAKKSNSLFKEGLFASFETPLVGSNQAMIGSPPMIPHQLQMRESCLSCHAGPSAPKEIRVTHPERVNCRQCHVPAENKESGIFIRQKK